MNLTIVRGQLRDVYARLIGTSLSVRQFPPAERQDGGGMVRIGDLATTAIALRNTAYSDVYDELNGNDAYHVKMPDGGLLIFQYVFGANGQLLRHRLAFFPSPTLPTVDEAPFLYEHDDLYGDIVETRLVRFPIRFDFDPNAHQDVVHPQSHLTLGQFENCRIPVSNPILPNTFVMFLLRNFYHRSYLKNKNRFEKRMKVGRAVDTITAAERRIAHLVVV